MNASHSSMSNMDRRVLQVIGCMIYDLLNLEIWIYLASQGVCFKSTKLQTLNFGISSVILYGYLSLAFFRYTAASMEASLNISQWE